jgi:hypothetical protein
MGSSADELQELQRLYPGAKELTEAGIRYILIPALRLPNGEVVEALLQPQAGNGYMTRLFLPKQIQGKGQNWNPFRILERNWMSWSWNNVPETDRFAQILAQHLNALR